MPPDALGQLTRLRALLDARQPLPGDLARWVLEQVASSLDRQELTDLRDQHLCRAGHLAGGSVRYRAGQVLREVQLLERRWNQHAIALPELGTFRGEVHAARLIAPIPAERRLRMILADGSALDRGGQLGAFNFP